MKLPSSDETPGKASPAKRYLANLDRALARYDEATEGYDFDAKAAMLGGAYVGGGILVGLIFVVFWNPEWTLWLDANSPALWAWTVRLLAGVLAAASVASLWFFGRALWFHGGRLFGTLVAIVAFLVGWGSAIKSWGWLLGLAFGWIPAAIVAAMAGALAWGVAPLLALALIAGGAWWAWTGGQ